MAPDATALADAAGYRFADASLLTQALTHRSFGVPHNERLEYLGDAALNLAIAGMVFKRYPQMPEGELSRLRANLVNQTVLAEVASRLGLGAALRLGEGELKTGGAQRPSILADAVEALIGAVYLDGGWEAAHGIVVHLFGELVADPQRAAPRKDAKTSLQEWLQGRRLALPAYTVLRIEGEAHRQTFHVECRFAPTSGGAPLVSAGSGPTRRAAEQAAAESALSTLKIDT